MNKTLLWLFWKDVLNCSLWIAIWAFGSLWSQEHSGKGNVKNNACMHLLGYAYPVWEAWETSGKGNMVYAQHSTTLERKRLFEAVTEGAQFLGSPYLNVTMQSTQHLPVSNSPGEGSWWGAWTTDLAGWPQRTGISGQQQVIGFGSFETETICATSEHHEMRVPYHSCVHTSLTVSFCCLEFLLLLSPVPGVWCRGTVWIWTSVMFWC